jgi:hypothetical protein
MISRFRSTLMNTKQQKDPVIDLLLDVKDLSERLSIIRGIWQVKHVTDGSVTNSMELSTSRDAASHAATQKLSRILWNPNVHYRVYKSPSTFSILSQINPVLYSSLGRAKNFHFFISSRPVLGSPSLLSNGYGGGAYFHGVKPPGRGTDHSPPTSAEVKKTWIYTYTRPYVFMV